MRTRVKVCGMRTAADVALAAEAGADALGFVAASPGSPRNLEPREAARLAALAPPFLQTVLVTRETQPARLAALQGACPTGALQVHGARDAAEAQAIRKAVQGPLILALGVQDSASLDHALQLEGHADAVLLDTAHPGGMTGGAGRPHDWRASARIARRLQKPAILAGGLTASNVAEAVRAVRPFAVDVSGGVEDARSRRKSPAKVRRFVAEVRALG